ncbi:MAG TPA: VOC family protein [Candidatus Saccharimonadales bacterium]|nr:VOC family protein [Candidatus Saccharimonadales bacterium]
MDIQTVTITVSNLQKSKEFYGGILGFTEGDYWAPTNWQSYRINGKLFGIREKGGFVRSESFDITNFEVDDVESLWAQVKDKAEVVEKLAPTPWGSYRFVIKDPDGYSVAFVARQEK